MPRWTLCTAAYAESELHFLQFLHRLYLQIQFSVLQKVPKVQRCENSPMCNNCNKLNSALFSESASMGTFQFDKLTPTGWVRTPERTQ